MDIFQSFTLGVVQGLTEFLPISSSGHLIIVPEFFNWGDFSNNITFDVSVHLGTAVAVLIFFWKDWLRIVSAFVKNLSKPKSLLSDFDSKFLIMIAVGSIPAAIVGLLFEDIIVEQIRRPEVVAVTLIVFALVLFYADRVGKKNRSFGKLNFKDAIFVGVAQALALVPGVSRSGITITAGLLANLDRETAARFSFMLATPTVFGAGALKVKDVMGVGFGDLGIEILIIGTLTSGVVGWMAIKYLFGYVLNHNYNLFVLYRLVIGIVALLLFF